MASEKQVNVVLPRELIAAYEGYKAHMIEEKAKKIGNKEIFGEALRLWLITNDLGFREAFQKARRQKASVLVQKEVDGKPVEIELTIEDVAEFNRNLLKHVEGEEPRASQQ